MTPIEDFKFKSYQRLLEEALTDESTAGDLYRYMADVSPDASAAKWLRKIAGQEDYHHLVISHLLAELSGVGEMGEQYEQRMEYLLGHRLEPPRPFPRTDTEWEDLGFDIEARLPDYPDVRYSVRDAVAIATGKREGDPDEAKRWLVRKAGELGVD